jgi:hypothetical protein
MTKSEATAITESTRRALRALMQCLQYNTPDSPTRMNFDEAYNEIERIHEMAHAELSVGKK